MLKKLLQPKKKSKKNLQNQLPKRNPLAPKKNQPKNQLGQKAELQAKKLLQNKGYTFIAQNFHSKYGEIDLIFMDQDQYVFVEVKARKNANFGHPLEFITPSKLDKIIKTIHYFFNRNNISNPSYRIDAISIASNKIKHLSNITA